MRPSPPASFNASLDSAHHSPWHASFPEDQGVKIPASISSGHAITSVPNREVKLDWSKSGQPPINAPSRRTGSYPPPVPKRKRDSPQPTSKKSRSEVPGNEFSQFVLVFENAPGALATVKHRRKLALKEWSNVLNLSLTKTVSNTPQSGYTQSVYGDGTALVGYSGQGVGHTVPVHESIDLAWFGLS